ncbi:Sec1 family protein [Nitzschia inconspicua]|uniref:Sec1 family protein n=1 Tax=Nitzschia inconspicua TaxID=303405 RepID=A0A9K3Q4M7_9STRA|nr:Sec1 family protein [Nitzschia inconspicua]
MSPTNRNNTPSITTTASEATVILPPPSALNPIPSLSAAFRLDNYEQLVEVLCQHPQRPTQSVHDFRQLLVFGDASFRTLLLRQVLSDPHTRTFSNPKKKKLNKNWDTANIFPLPKVLQSNVVGTKVLLLQTDTTTSFGNNNNNNNINNTPRTTKVGLEIEFRQHHHTTNDKSISAAMSNLKNPFAAASGGGGGGNKNNSYDENQDESSDIYWSLQESTSEHVDVVTYFLRPWDMDHTMAAIRRIALAGSTTSNTSSSGGSNAVHHRLVYIPQITAMVSQVLQDTGLAAAKNVSIRSLQLDVFPIESDLFSLEYPSNIDSLLETPSAMIQTTARALLKVQDVTGTIARIQSLGAEDVVAQLLNMTVDESVLAGRNKNNTSNQENNVDWEEDEDNPQQGNANVHATDNTINTNLVMMVLDRQLDMVTPMVTPLTYEGLLDHVVGIQHGFVHLDEQIIHPLEDQDEAERQAKNNNRGKDDRTNPFDDDTTTTAPEGVLVVPKRVTLGVHAGDTLYAEVRDQHVEKFGSFLQNQALALKESHSNFTSKGTKKDLHEIHQFVKQIPIFTQSLRSLTNHIHLAELIKATTEEVVFREQWNTERAMIEGETCYDILEELVFSSYPPYQLLRLLCLQSLTSGGIKANRYDAFRQYIVQVYGYQFLPVLHDLEKLGWIKRKDTLFLDSARSPFQSIRRNLILIHAEVDTVEPDDVSYVSSGYAPLSVRLVQSAMQGWGDKKDALQELFSGSTGGGRLLDVEQTHPPQDLSTALKQQQPQSPFKKNSLGEYAKQKMAASGVGRKKPTLIVVYVGGITYMEIAALRFLSKRDTFPYHIIIVTTQVLNGSKIIQQLG